MFLKRASVFLLLLVLFDAHYGAAGISFDENRYELNVALSEDALKVDSANYAQFLQKVKELFTQASDFLFKATNYRAYIGTVNILTPRFWAVSTSTTTAFSYASADVRVEETKQDDEITIINDLRTKNPKQCGQPGDHIIVPPSLFTNAGNWSDAYGDRVKTFIHEFARFRYGVFEEYGYESEEGNQMFPYSFTNVYGYTQVTGCNNTAITGRLALKNDPGKSCILNQTETPSCRFFPDLNAEQGPTTSLMFMHFIKSTTKFCDDSSHDRAAPNRQNHFCRNRSVKTIIDNSIDFREAEQLSANTNTTPTFNIYVAASTVVYVVFDTATHDGRDEADFNSAKAKVAEALINGLNNLSKKVLMGIATMGAAITEVQTPTQVQGNVVALRNKVRSIVRGGTQLNVEKGILEVGHKMKSFAHLSGSVVLFFKFNGRTDLTPNYESESIGFLNTRNVRLFTYEPLFGSDGNSLEYISIGSYGRYESANDALYNKSIDSIISATIDAAQDSKYRIPKIPLMARTAQATSSARITGTIKNDYRPAGLEMVFFVPVSATGYNVLVNNLPLSTTPQYKSWDGKYNIYVSSFNSSTSKEHPYEITTTSNTPLSVHISAAQILKYDDPFYLGGGGMVTNRPAEVEITTSGDGGLLDMRPEINEDASFLIYASIRKGVYAVTNQPVVALVQVPGGIIKQVDLKDNGLYPDILGGDGIYSGHFKPDSIDGIYTISVHIGYTISNTRTRSLPIDQGTYCCGPSFVGDTSSAVVQRYIPYAATLEVVGAAAYKEKPVRITDFGIGTDDSNANDVVTFQWTAPAASFGATGKVDYYKIVYGDDSTEVIDPVRGVIPASAKLVDEKYLVSGTLQPTIPGSYQSVSINVTELAKSASISSTLLYFTISSVKNGTSESYPAPLVYRGKTLPGLTTTTSTTTTTTTTTTTKPSTTSTLKPTASTKSTASTESITSTKPAITTTIAITSTAGGNNGTPRHCGSLIVTLMLFISLRFFTLFHFNTFSK